jgi:hypothetical protein
VRACKGARVCGGGYKLGEGVRVRACGGRELCASEDVCACVHLGVGVGCVCMRESVCVRVCALKEIWPG